MDDLSDRVIQLEIDFVKTTVINESIDKRLILLEHLLNENQKITNEIKRQLEIRNERIKILKGILISLATVMGAVSGLHLKKFIDGIFS